MFFLDLAFYCIKAAIDEHEAFIRWSVTTRPLTILFLGAFVALGYENSENLHIRAHRCCRDALDGGRAPGGKAGRGARPAWPRPPPAPVGAVAGISRAARAALMMAIDPVEARAMRRRGPSPAASPRTPVARTDAGLRGGAETPTPVNMKECFA